MGSLLFFFAITDNIMQKAVFFSPLMSGVFSPFTRPKPNSLSDHRHCEMPLAFSSTIVGLPFSWVAGIIASAWLTTALYCFALAFRRTLRICQWMFHLAWLLGNVPTKTDVSNHWKASFFWVNRLLASIDNSSISVTGITPKEWLNSLRLPNPRYTVLTWIDKRSIQLLF